MLESHTPLEQGGRHILDGATVVVVVELVEVVFGAAKGKKGSFIIVLLVIFEL